MLTTEMNRCLEDANFLASNLGQREVDVWHVAVALLSDADVSAAIRSLGVDPELALARIMSSYGADPKSHFNWEEEIAASSPTPSVGVTSLARASFDYAQKRNQDKVTPVFFLRSILRFNGGVPGEVLTSMGLSSVAIDEWLDRHERAKALRAREIPAELSEYCRDLVLEAVDGKLDPVIGRDAQIARIASILKRRKKNNPILVGEPGVGKTAVVEGLARLIAEGSAGQGLGDARILALDVARIIGGTKHRGDLEQRLQAILDRLAEDRSLILFIDETHVIVGGASGMTDASNLLKPALASGRIRCIGATTHGEYAKYFDADPALARRFLAVNVPEPTPQEAAVILERMVPEYSSHHGVTYDPRAVKAALDLTVRYLLSRRLPDKALDALDEAGALASRRGDATVTERHVLEILSETCGPSIQAASLDAAMIGKSLSDVVRGQDEACSAVAALMARSASPFASHRGTRASIMISGGCGTGKKLLIGTLAHALGLPVHHLDMSEYRQEHTVSRLIGPPPGYVGFGSGGRLTEIARRNPSCVIFLDRMEAAHPDVHAIVAQAIKNGVLTDTSERVVSFKGAIVVMAVRTEDEEGGSFGFMSKPDKRETEGLDKKFSPDFLDLIDLTVDLSPLAKPALRRIAEDMADALVRRLADKGVGVSIESDVIDAVVEEVAAAGKGARPMAKVFRKMVENPVIDHASFLPTDGDGAEITVAAKGVVVNAMQLQGSSAA